MTQSVLQTIADDLRGTTEGLKVATETLNDLISEGWELDRQIQQQKAIVVGLKDSKESLIRQMQEILNAG